MTDINYDLIAVSVWEAVTSRGPGSRITIDELDNIFEQNGLDVVRRGGLRRDSWNYQRSLERKRVNRLLREMHGVTLEVMTRGNPPTYGFVSAVDQMVSAPFYQSVGFNRRLNRHFANVEREINRELACLEGREPEDMKRWVELCRRNLKRSISGIQDQLEQAAIQAGLRKHVPKLAEVHDLHTHRQRRGRKGT